MIIIRDESKIDEEDRKKQEEETRESLLEHELMALYTHAPYLGEWNTFIKIGDALKETYGKLEPLNADNGSDIFGHEDGINFNDLYQIAKEEDIVNEIPTPMQSSLHFDVRPIESVKIKYNSYKSIGDDNDHKQSENESSSGFGWFGSGSNETKQKHVIPASTDWMELTNDNYNDHITPMSICRLGGVQKSMSISKCVPRVQGPIFYDGKLKMRGSTTFMAPRDDYYNTDTNVNNNKIDTIIPQNVPLNGVNDFVQIRQTEEWDLKPIIKEKTNELEGTVKIRREPVNIDDKCDSFEIEYDCILKLATNSEDYY